MKYKNFASNLFFICSRLFHFKAPKLLELYVKYDFYNDIHKEISLFDSEDRVELMGYYTDQFEHQIHLMELI